MRKVKERCYCYNGRCLKFWQFKAEEDGKPSLRLRARVRLPSYSDEEVLASPVAKITDDRS